MEKAPFFPDMDGGLCCKEPPSGYSFFHFKENVKLLLFSLYCLLLVGLGLAIKLEWKNLFLDSVAMCDRL